MAFSLTQFFNDNFHLLQKKLEMNENNLIFKLFWEKTNEVFYRYFSTLLSSPNVIGN